MSDFNIDVGAIPMTQSDGGYSLPITYPFQPRKVAVSETAKIGTETYDEKYFQRKGQELYYTGPNLVNQNGEIERAPYGGSSSKLRQESYQFIAGITDVNDRRAFLNILADRGMYEGGKPSRSMVDSKDLEAVGKYLLTMDRYGTTGLAGLGLFREEYPGGQASGGPSVRVTAREDVEKVLRDESLRLLGRPLTAREAREAVQFVQQQQVQRAGSAQQAPALSTAAATAVQAGREGEVAVQGAARAAEVLERLIGR
jgi:hypothetical protein